jgi:hypothetical protein
MTGAATGAGEPRWIMTTTATSATTNDTLAIPIATIGSLRDIAGSCVVSAARQSESHACRN